MGSSRSVAPAEAATNPRPGMRTELLLAAQYDGRVFLPIDIVCRDFFSHLSVEKFVRKVSLGEIRLPIIRMDGSLKTARCIHLSDLASYLDERRVAALKEAKQLERAP